MAWKFTVIAVTAFGISEKYSEFGYVPVLASVATDESRMVYEMVSVDGVTVDVELAAQIEPKLDVVLPVVLVVTKLMGPDQLPAVKPVQSIVQLYV